MANGGESGQRGCEEEISALKQKISESRNDTKRNEEEMSDAAEKCYAGEIEKLKKESHSVNLFLTGAVCVSALCTAGLLVIDKIPMGELRNCLACLAASVLGSSTSAFISALDRRAHGWEVHGVKIPSGDGERFNEKMAPFFRKRPFLGLFTGILVFSAMHAHLLLKDECPTAADPAVDVMNRMVFYSLLAGLFAKSLIEKLKVLFDKVFG
jgi:hypothetical protein